METKKDRQLAAIRSAEKKELEFQQIRVMLSQRYADEYSEFQPGDRVTFSEYGWDSRRTNGVIHTIRFDLDKGMGYYITVHTKDWREAKRRARVVLWDKWIKNRQLEKV